jgi:hypothetical protein
MRNLSTGRTLLVVITGVLGLASISCVICAIVMPLVMSSFQPSSSGESRYGEATDFCSIGDATIVLYEGSNGATTRMGYVVTYQSASQTEEGFFFAYAEPVVENIKCSGGGVTLYFDEGAPRTYTDAQITGSLIKEPIRYTHGELEPPDRGMLHMNPFTLCISVAGVLAVVMLTVSVVLYRTGRRPAPEQS